VQESISDNLDGILVDRAEIEQVKGMLMVVYDIDAGAAFEILRWRSQELNIKISALARHLAKELPRRLTVDASRRAPVDHLLMRPF
jgi:AmiR/NasT family two-component response regulator